MRRRWRRMRSTDPAELNITAFMNLMVVLVPFLLITAVFSRMAILELELPASGGETTGEPGFALEVVLRAGRIDVSDRATGPLAELPHIAGVPDLDRLSTLLRELKARLPDETAATLLLEPDIDYATLVQVMDAVRAFAVARADGVTMAELFPDIALGDAPPATAAVAATGH